MNEEIRPAALRRQLKRILQVAGGNFLENYDLTIFAYFATSIGTTYFPRADAYASLMLAFATFGAGYFFRPIGALLLGAYIDRFGRRPGLLLTLSLMGLGTLLIGITPGYTTIGITAPLVAVLGRMLQGFSAGGEIGGVAVYLSEIAGPNRRGLYVSLQSGTQQVGVIFAAVLGFVLARSLGSEALTVWGWRVPILLGCAIIPLFFMLRRSLEETEMFRQQTHHPRLNEILVSTAVNWRTIVIGMMMIANTSVTFYFITVYTPTFGRTVLHLAPTDIFLVVLCVGLSNLFWLPISGALSDKIGRRPILIATTLLAIFTTYPALSWLIQAPSLGRLMAVELWLSFMFGNYNGAAIVRLLEIMPSTLRTTGFSLANALGPTVFGGFTPLLSTWLIHVSDNQAMPGLWLSFAALLGLIGAFLGRTAKADVGSRLLE